MVACIDFFEMSEICRPKFIVRHSTKLREIFLLILSAQYTKKKIYLRVAMKYMYLFNVI
jgi:hypothetical protein